MKTIEGQLKDKIEELESKLEMVIAIDTSRAKEVVRLQKENKELKEAVGKEAGKVIAALSEGMSTLNTIIAKNEK